MYIKRIRQGVVNPCPNIVVEKITGADSKVAGDEGMGFLAGNRAMDEAIQLAKTSGIGLVGVKRSTHYGMAAFYVMQAIEVRYISPRLHEFVSCYSRVGRLFRISWSKSICSRCP